MYEATFRICESTPTKDFIEEVENYFVVIHRHKNQKFYLYDWSGQRVNERMYPTVLKFMKYGREPVRNNSENAQNDESRFNLLYCGDWQFPETLKKLNHLKRQYEIEQ